MVGLIVHSTTPFNAETPLDRLRGDFVTPQRNFYVRSHGAVPSIASEAHRLRVDGRVERKLELSMHDLRANFPTRTVMAVLQCAGNRRAELNRLRPVTGDPWAGGAIGNAAWAGVSLADVLQAAGIEVGQAADAGPSSVSSGAEANLHVAFDACDTVQERDRYGVSIPLAKALCPEVLLAFEMNGEPLAPEHGFPLRVVVPGFAGVRSAKWLTGITVQEAPSANAIQHSDYKLLPADVTPDTVDWDKGITINEMPLNSVICEPAAGARINPGAITVRGYAMVSGRTIQRVDLSADGGRHWCQAALDCRPRAPWSWTFWETTIDLPAGEHELVVRAWDSAGQTQPAMAEDAWNFKGYLCATWHRVQLRAA